MSIRPYVESLPISLLRARETSMRQFRPMLARHGLTEQQWRVLRVLTAGEPVDAGQIAERAVLLAPSLSRILAHLDARGLIERRAAIADQRRSMVALTPAGWQVVDAVAPESEAIYAEIEAGFGKQRLRHLLAELDALATMQPAAGDD